MTNSVRRPRGKEITRRNFVKAVAVGGGLLALGGLWKEVFDMITAPPKEEELKVLKLKDTYIQFRGTVFQLYPVEAQSHDSPLALVHRANQQYNQGKNIRGDLEYRAADLFSILHRNPIENSVQNQIHSLRATVPVPPTIYAQRTYQVPVQVNYNSLEDVIASYKR